MSLKANENEVHSEKPTDEAASGTAEKSSKPVTDTQRGSGTGTLRANERGVNRTSRATSLLRWIIGVIPTILIMSVLAGLGFWGHHHGWKIPKFSELTGKRQLKDAAWCDEHGVPEADCIACNAGLMPKGKLRGWCEEHGVHECVLDHPELAQLDETPEVSQEDFERAARAIALRPRIENDPKCKLHLRRIQFPSTEAVEKAGIDIGLVDRGPVLESISATGEIVYDPTRVARLASRAPGTVWRVDKNIGDQVRQGDILALVDAAEVGNVKSELHQAVVQLNLQSRNYERLSKLGSAVAGVRLLETESAKAEAEVALQKAIQTLVNLGLPITYDEVITTPEDQLQQKIQFLGLPVSIVKQFRSEKTTSNLLPIFAPRDGVVVKRDVVAGEVIDTSKTLFTIADNSLMWLVLNVPLEEAKYANIGQKIVFRPDGTDHTVTGKLTWISTDVDHETRTVEIRGELPNEDGSLRNETFGGGEIVLREEDDAIIVPSSAVHWEGCCHVVFVRDKNFMKEGSYKVFHTRSVRPGVTMGDYTEILAGVLPGEVIVTEGSGVLRAELLKGNLGAG